MKRKEITLLKLTKVWMWPREKPVALFEHLMTKLGLTFLTVITA